MIVKVFSTKVCPKCQRLKQRINAGIKAKKEKVANGQEEWKGRGKDKQPRSKEGYFRRWKKQEMD